MCDIIKAWGISSFGRALLWHRRGEEFESPILHHFCIIIFWKHDIMKIKHEIFEESRKQIYISRFDAEKYFNEEFSKLKDNFSNDEEVRVLNYNGLGGIGKTCLIEHLAQKLLAEKSAMVVRHDFSQIIDMQNTLLSIKRQLETKYGFSFPLFDAARFAFCQKIGQEAKRKEAQAILEKSPALKLAWDNIDKVIDLEQIKVLKLGMWLFETGDRVATIFKNRKDEYRKRFLEVDMMSDDEIMKLLPEYFSFDLKNNLEKAKKPLVVFLDTYENLLDVDRAMTTKGQPADSDEWLRDGPVRSVPGILWVIAGREEIHWEKEDPEWAESIRKLKLSAFSKEMTKEYLEKNGVGTAEIYDDIFEETGGVPGQLEYCAEIARQKAGEKLTMKDFGKSTELFSRRYIKNRTPVELEVMYIMAMAGIFTEEMILEFGQKISSAFSLVQFKMLEDSSFVAKVEENYIINRTVRGTLLSQCPESIRKKSAKVLLSSFQNKLDEIRPDDIFKNTYEAEYIYFAFLSGEERAISNALICLLNMYYGMAYTDFMQVCKRIFDEKIEVDEKNRTNFSLVKGMYLSLKGEILEAEKALEEAFKAAGKNKEQKARIVRLLTELYDIVPNFDPTPEIDEFIEEQLELGPEQSGLEEYQGVAMFAKFRKTVDIQPSQYIINIALKLAPKMTGENEIAASAAMVEYAAEAKYFPTRLVAVPISKALDEAKNKGTRGYVEARFAIGNAFLKSGNYELAMHNFLEVFGCAAGVRAGRFGLMKVRAILNYFEAMKKLVGPFREPEKKLAEQRAKLYEQFGSGLDRDNLYDIATLYALMPEDELKEFVKDTEKKFVYRKMCVQELNIVSQILRLRGEKYNEYILKHICRELETPTKYNATFAIEFFSSNIGADFNEDPQYAIKQVFSYIDFATKELGSAAYCKFLYQAADAIELSKGDWSEVYAKMATTATLAFSNAETRIAVALAFLRRCSKKAILENKDAKELLVGVARGRKYFESERDGKKYYGVNFYALEAISIVDKLNRESERPKKMGYEAIEKWQETKNGVFLRAAFMLFSNCITISNDTNNIAASVIELMPTLVEMEEKYIGKYSRERLELSTLQAVLARKLKRENAAEMFSEMGILAMHTKMSEEVVTTFYLQLIDAKDEKSKKVVKYNYFKNFEDDVRAIQFLLAK